MLFTTVLFNIDFGFDVIPTGDEVVVPSEVKIKF